MKIYLVHLWILTSIISFGINFYAGIISSLATIVILSEKYELEYYKELNKTSQSD